MEGKMIFYYNTKQAGFNKRWINMDMETIKSMMGEIMDTPIEL
jgi:hypothetical protein